MDFVVTEQPSTAFESNFAHQRQSALAGLESLATCEELQILQHWPGCLERK
jgi:hypothetical protein